MKINASLSTLANIIALVNGVNAGLNLTDEQVTIGQASAYVPGEGDLNSQITLSGVNGKGFQGDVTIHYKRPVLQPGGAWGNALGDGIPSVPSAATQAQALTLAATHLGLVESELDASAFTAPADELTNGSITITAKDGSPLYTGSYVLTLVGQDTDQNLADAVTVTDMDGFDDADA